MIFEIEFNRAARASMVAAVGLAVVAIGASPAHAAKTGAWTTTIPHTSTTSNGVTVTMASTTAFTTVANASMGTTNFWNDPFAAVPTTSIPNSGSIDFIATAVATQTVTFTFNKPVNNPVLHLERMGGSVNGFTNSSNWLLAGSNLPTLPTLNRLSGNFQFQVAGGAFFRTPGVTYSAAGCSVASATATTDDGSNGCGSVQVNGTGITSLTFTVTFLGGAGAGDGIELLWSIGGSRIAVSKQSTYGTGTFAFSGTNGLGPTSLDTNAANPATSSYFDVVNHAQPLTITETVPSDYVLTGASCVDQSGVAVTASLASNVLTIPAANYRANQNIICTFANRRTPATDLVITKTDGISSTFSGSTNNYSLVVTNNGPDSITGAIVRDIPGAGITCPPTNPVVISGSGVPTGSFTIANLTAVSGITLGTLGNGQSATLTFSCQVN
ncbi:MAG: DUF11 domain-containing protein [Sphingomonadales bacterium]|jgi:hypothetical protein|nr:DUF11 domain-containing protein [Sphingomonadales bacterium]